MLALGLAMLMGFLFVATCSLWLARHGISPMLLLSAGMGLALLAELAELAILLQLAPALWLWPLLGVSFSLSNIAYSQLSAAFPVALSGRVNTALNLLVFVGAFGLQWGIGAALDLGVAQGLSYAGAFKWTLGLILAAQLLAYAWFLRPAPLKAVQ